MIRNMFKSQLEDGEYDLFFLVGFRKNLFWRDLTSQELVNKDKPLMKEFQSFNDLGKISYKCLRVSKRYKIAVIGIRPLALFISRTAFHFIVRKVVRPT